MTFSGKVPVRPSCSGNRFPLSIPPRAREYSRNFLEMRTLLSAPLQTNEEKRKSRRDSVQRDHIVTVLQQTDWVVDGPRGAAQVLGPHPNTLRNRLKKLGITRASHQIR
jgi:transcriptional regulator with GAF, ATPase, and Fis domain